jgi:hypothetical protein
MDYNFNAETICNYLKKHKDELEILYTENVGLKALTELNLIVGGYNPIVGNTAFDSELLLKKFIYEAFSNCSTDYSCEISKKLSNWIVRSWGGIYTSEESTEILMDALRNESVVRFNRISSKSKILSFRYPEDNLVYDSRVAYVLNWIILSENAGEKYFPIPEGRNSRMMAFDMKVLIRLKHVREYKIDSESDFSRRFIRDRDSRLFIKDDEAYTVLVKLIKEVHSLLWKDNKDRKELYYTEMLLFSIADTKVYKDVTDNFITLVNGVN